MNEKLSVLYSGGGTLGPVTPLIAIHEVLKAEYGFEYQPYWVGIKSGVEKNLVVNANIPYYEISAGKLRRYISVWNITDLIKIVFGFFQSIVLLKKVKPDFCVSAGGYVSVPVHLAAWFLGIPSWIHQQDIQIGLANKIMSAVAKKITVSFREQEKFFSKNKTSWLGNPIRKLFYDIEKEKAYSFFGIANDAPVTLAMGGGTGSVRVNELIHESLPHLENVCDIIHLSGKERSKKRVSVAGNSYGEWYHPYEFLDAEMALAYAVADIVICRGGFGTVSELAALKKTAIIIPKPGHQVENARVIAKLGGAIMLDEKIADGNALAKTVKDLLANREEMSALAEKLHEILPPASPEDILGIVQNLAEEK